MKSIKKNFFESLKKNKIGVLGTHHTINLFLSKLKYLINQTWIFDIIERSLEVFQFCQSINVITLIHFLKQLIKKEIINEIIIAYKKDLIYISKILLFKSIRSFNPFKSNSCWIYFYQGS